MRKINQKKILTRAIVLLVPLLFTYCQVKQLAGAGVETTNGCINGTLLNKTGAPGSHTIVKLFPENFDPIKDTTHVPADTTDTLGRYSFTNIGSGRYSVVSVRIDIRTSSFVNNIVVEADTVTIPADTLEKPGTIKITLPSGVDPINGYVYVPGTALYSLLTGNNGTVVLDSVPASANLSVYYAVRGGAANPPQVIADSVVVLPGDSTTIAYSEWKSSKKLFLNTTATGANIPGNVYNFPVLVRLNAGNFNFPQAQVSGNDIRFTKENGTPLSYEIERWDSTGSVAEIWVRVDTVFGNDSSQYITMYWGLRSTGSATQSLSNSAAVFDTTNGFGGVWHMGPAVNNIVPDATINHYDGTLSDTAPIPAQGTIGMGYQFDGIDNSMSIKGTANSALNFPENGFYTLCAWVYADTLDYAPATDSIYANDMTIISKDNCQYALKTRTNNWEFDEFHTLSGWQGTLAPATQRAWKYVVGVRQGTRQYLYVDGKCIVDSVSAFSPKNEPRTTIADVTIGKMPGKRWASLTTDGPGCFFNGTIDEVRIMTKAMSADYIKLCFMNQKYPDALVVFK